jgi:hypothetical protein
LADDIRDIGSILGAAQEIEDIKGSFDQLLKTSSAFEKILGNIAQESEDIPAKFARGDRLLKAMVEDSKLLEKVQSRTFKFIGKALDQAVASIKEMGGDYKSFEKTAQHVNKVLQGEFDVLRESANQTKKKALALEDVKKITDDLASKLKKPSTAFEGMLNSMGQFPGQLLKAKDETKSWGGAVKSVAGASKFGKLAKMVAKGGPIVLGIMAITAALTVLWKLFKSYWDFMDTKVMPTMAAVNKEFGNMGEATREVKQFAVKAGDQFALLGMSFEQGAQAATKVSSSMKTIAFEEGQLDTALKLSEYVGLGAEQTGKLMNAFTKTGGSLKDLNEGMNRATELSQEYGVSAQGIRRELGQNIDLIQRFGTRNIMELEKSIAKVNQYGLSIKEVDAAYGTQMDTFEKTADVGAKLNAMFGTHINSFELMMETNPEKRMEMLRKELDRVGKSFNLMNEFEQNVVASTMDVTREQASLMLGSDEAREKYKKLAAEKLKNKKFDEDWEKGIRNLKKTLLPWSKLLELLMRNVVDLVSAMFGFEDPGKNMIEIADKIQKFMTKATKKVGEWAKAWREGGKELPQPLKQLKFLISLFKLLWKVTSVPIKLLGKFISKVIDLGMWLEKTTGIFSEMSKGVEWLGDKFDEVTTFLGEINWSELLFDIPKKALQKLITWLVANAGKIAKYLNPIAAIKDIGSSAMSTVKGLFSGEATPAVAAAPARTVAPSVAGTAAKAAAGAAGEMVVRLVVEADDSALAKAISIKQVRVSRTGT